MVGNQRVTRAHDSETAARDGDSAARDGETVQMLPEREVRFPTTVHWAHRRPLGLGPATLLTGLAGITFAFAIVMFAVGSWAAALVLLAASATEVCLFLVAVRRDPDAHSARVARLAARQTDGLMRLSAVTIRASTHTGVELARLWHRRRRLRTQFRRRLTPLGEAVYHDDQHRAKQLKAQAKQLDRELGETDRRAAEAFASLREEIDRERLPNQGTQRLPIASDPNGSR